MTAHGTMLIGLGVALASLLGGYGAHRVYSRSDGVDRVATSAAPAPPSTMSGATPRNGGAPATPSPAVGHRPSSVPPRLGRVVSAEATNLLVSREDVDRDFDAGVVTNGAASRLVARIQQQLGGAADDVMIEDCFERAQIAVPRTVAIELEVQSSADAVDLLRLQVDGSSPAVQDCVRDIVGAIRLPRRESERPYLAREATVQLDLALDHDR